MPQRGSVEKACRASRTHCTLGFDGGDLAGAAQLEPLLSGKTCHEPNGAGSFHGSYTMVLPELIAEAIFAGRARLVAQEQPDIASASAMFAVAAHAPAAHRSGGEGGLRSAWIISNLEQLPGHGLCSGLRPDSAGRDGTRVRPRRNFPEGRQPGSHPAPGPRRTRLYPAQVLAYGATAGASTRARGRQLSGWP